MLNRHGQAVGGDDPCPVFRYCVVLFEPRATFKTISASAMFKVGGLVIATMLQLWSYRRYDRSSVLEGSLRAPPSHLQVPED
jgi:hypothetical protein